MESIDELKEIIKNCLCLYFDDIIKIEDFNLIIFYWMKNYMKIFWLMTFHAKL